MFRSLRDGLLKEFFERLSASHGVAQRYFNGNDQTGAQIAAVGERDAEVGDGASERINEHDLLPSLELP